MNTSKQQTFAVIDACNGGVVVAILPTFRRAKNASTRMNKAAGIEYGDVKSGWRFLNTPARLVSAAAMFAIPEPAPTLTRDEQRLMRDVSAEAEFGNAFYIRKTEKNLRATAVALVKRKFLLMVGANEFEMTELGAEQSF